MIGQEKSSSVAGKSALSTVKNLSPFQRPGLEPDGLGERCDFSEQTINLMLTLPVVYFPLSLLFHAVFVSQPV